MFEPTRSFDPPFLVGYDLQFLLTWIDEILRSGNV
jgi:hypothetical protein